MAGPEQSPLRVVPPALRPRASNVRAGGHSTVEEAARGWGPGTRGQRGLSPDTPVPARGSRAQSGRRLPSRWCEHPGSFATRGAGECGLLPRESVASGPRCNPQRGESHHTRSSGGGTSRSVSHLDGERLGGGSSRPRARLEERDRGQGRALVHSPVNAAQPSRCACSPGAAQSPEQAPGTSGHTPSCETRASPQSSTTSAPRAFILGVQPVVKAGWNCPPPRLPRSRRSHSWPANWGCLPRSVLLGAGQRAGEGKEVSSRAPEAS